MYVVCISIEESWINRTDSFNVDTKKKKEEEEKLFIIQSNYSLYNNKNHNFVYSFTGDRKTRRTNLE